MKWVFIVLGILILIVLVIIIIGKMLPVKHIATETINLPMSRSQVWNAVRNFGDYPEWRAGIKDLQVIDDKTWRETDKQNTVITFGIIEEVENERLVAKILDDNLPFGGTWTYEISGDESATSLTITENGEVYNPFFRFVSHFFMDQSGTIKGYQADLKKKFEL